MVESRKALTGSGPASMGEGMHAIAALWAQTHPAPLHDICVLDLNRCEVRSFRGDQSLLLSNAPNRKRARFSI